MSEWKYIVFDTPSNGDTIILFPPMVPHDLLRNALVGPIVSAGFIRYDERHKMLWQVGFPRSGLASEYRRYLRLQVTQDWTLA